MRRLTLYLDNSSWNLAANSVQPSIMSNGIIVCYSIDNLLELLSTSSPCKRDDLDNQLDQLSAEFLENCGESGSGFTYETSLKKLNKDERGILFENAKQVSPIGGFGLLDYLQKMIGGIASKGYNSIGEESLKNLRVMLYTAINELEDSAEKIAWRRYAQDTLQHAEVAINNLTKLLETHEEYRIPELNPAKIANFSGEGAAEKVLREAEKSNAKYVVDTFLDDVPIDRRVSRQMEATRDQILRLAQTLFFLRYNRESKNMRDSEQARSDFQGSWTDLEHIANASACSIFHTSDKRQSNIASAVYDHLNVPTFVLYYSVKDDRTEVRHEPSKLNVQIDMDTR